MSENVQNIQTYPNSATDACPPTEQQAASQPEECCVWLSARDAAQVLEDVQNPPSPNKAALEAAKRFRQNYG